MDAADVDGGLDVDLLVAERLVGSFDLDALLAGRTSSERTANSAVLDSDTSDNSAGGSNDPHATPASKRSDGKPRRTRRVTNKERITRLRELVKQLAKELEMLQDGRPCGVRATSNSEDRLVRSSNKSMWQQVAQRQRDRRRKAESDNDSLREMLRIQMEEAASLRRLFKRRHRIKLLSDMLQVQLTTTLPASIAPSAVNSTTSFQKLMRDCDELHEGIDPFFIQIGVCELSCPGQQRQASRSIVHGDIFKIMLRSRVPFGVLDTTNAVWVCLNMMGKRGQDKAKNFNQNVENYVQHLEEKTDMVTRSMFTKTPWLEGVSCAHIQSVSRKYIDEDQGVVISRTVIDPKMQDENSCATYQDHSTLQVLVRADKQSRCQAEPSAEMQIHFRAYRHNLGRTNSVSGQQGVNFGISLWDELISRIPEEVETYLIDKSCEQKSNCIRVADC